jgi:acetylglutamate kinase
MEQLIEKARILTEALPYIKKFYGKTVVIKYGGSAMQEESLRETTTLDIVLMKYVGMNPVIVHGGGIKITEALKEKGKDSEFIEGLRVTNRETLKIVKEVLEKINREIQDLIAKHGGKASSLNGLDFILAKKYIPQSQEDIGFVGEVEKITPRIIEEENRKGKIPVVTPLGKSKEGEIYNINADSVAGELSRALQAEKLVLLTDVQGILKGDNLISTLNEEEVKKFIEEGVISEGMIPKVKSCLSAIEGGAKKAHIIDGRISHALLLEIYTEKGIGTEIIK